MLVSGGWLKSCVSKFWVAQNCARKFRVTILLRDPLTIPEPGARFVSFHLFWEGACGLWIVDYVGGSQTPADNSDTRHWPSQPLQPVTGRSSANKLAFMWWQRQCKKFIIVRETSCVSVELLTFDNYSLKMRQNSACLK